MNIFEKKSSVGGEVILLTLSKVVTLLITTITTMLIARFRTVGEYGTYSELFLVVNLATSLMMLGLPSSVNFYLARAETTSERKNFLSVYYTLSTILSVIIGLILVMAIPFIEGYFHNSAIRSFYYFLLIYPWAYIVDGSVENLLVVYKRTSLLVVYRLLYSVVMLGVAVGVQWIGYGFSEYMVCFVVANVVFSIWVYRMANSLSGGIGFLIDKKIIKSIIVFSVPMGLSTFVGTLNSEIDKLLIGYLMSTEEMAIYTNAAKELPLTIVAASITAILMPKLTVMVKNKQTKKAVEMWGRATELSLIIIAHIVIGVFVFAEEVLTILYSAKYIEGVTVFRIYTLNLLMRVTYFGLILNAYGETKKIMYCSIASLGLNIVLNPIFYMFFGMIGPAIATFISIALVMLLQLSMTAKVSKIKISGLIPWKRLSKIIIINFCFGIVFYIIKKVLPFETVFGDICEVVLLGVIWSLIYFYVMKKQIKSAWNSLNREVTEK